MMNRPRRNPAPPRMLDYNGLRGDEDRALRRAISASLNDLETPGTSERPLQPGAQTKAESTDRAQSSSKTVNGTDDSVASRQPVAVGSSEQRLTIKTSQRSSFGKAGHVNNELRGKLQSRRTVTRKFALLPSASKLCVAEQTNVTDQRDNQLLSSGSSSAVGTPCSSFEEGPPMRCTEDLLTFLCLRGHKGMPPELNVFQHHPLLTENREVVSQAEEEVVNPLSPYQHQLDVRENDLQVRTETGTSLVDGQMDVDVEELTNFSDRSFVMSDTDEYPVTLPGGDCSPYSDQQDQYGRSSLLAGKGVAEATEEAWRLREDQLGRVRDFVLHSQEGCKEESEGQQQEKFDLAGVPPLEPSTTQWQQPPRAKDAELLQSPCESDFSSYSGGERIPSPPPLLHCRPPEALARLDCVSGCSTVTPHLANGQCTVSVRPLPNGILKGVVSIDLTKEDGPVITAHNCVTDSKGKSKKGKSARKRKHSSASSEPEMPPLSLATEADLKRSLPVCVPLIGGASENTVRTNLPRWGNTFQSAVVSQGRDTVDSAKHLEGVHSGVVGDKKADTAQPVQVPVIQGAMVPRSNRKQKPDTALKERPKKPLVNDVLFPPLPRHSSGEQDMDLSKRLPPVTVYHPTTEQFKDPVAYLSMIEPDASKMGMCIIQPPAPFKPSSLDLAADARLRNHWQYINRVFHRWLPNARRMEAIRRFLNDHGISLNPGPMICGLAVDLVAVSQAVQHLGGADTVMKNDLWSEVAILAKIPKTAVNGAADLKRVYMDYLHKFDSLSEPERRRYQSNVDVGLSGFTRASDRVSSGPEVVTMELNGRTLKDYFSVSQHMRAAWYNHYTTAAQVEQDFWKHTLEGHYQIAPENGTFVNLADCSTIRSQEFCRSTWNFTTLSSRDSLLRFVDVAEGLNRPMVTTSMVYSARCWHTAPHALYTLHCIHRGGPQVWYSVPGKEHDETEIVITQLSSELCGRKSASTRHRLRQNLQAMPSPTSLVNKKLPVYRGVLKEGQILVVFPKAHIASVSTDFTVSEMAYFAPPQWLPYGLEYFDESSNDYTEPLFCVTELIFRAAQDNRLSREALKYILPGLRVLRKHEADLRKLLVDNRLAQQLPMEVPIGGKHSRVKGLQSISLTPGNFTQKCRACHQFCTLSKVTETGGTALCLRHARARLAMTSRLHELLLVCRVPLDDFDRLIQSVISRLEKQS